ncbi:sigma-70 family RNA polymerase sigma factor [Thermorudis peleae]|uniref:sigma-70 family RNA polymerase sigma factor n=1 Tax=Thermorudis peleae TaxID=1382356 RepID=UPI00068DCE0B|nr:sigma-70 family RNA polymerase sigma factor [Thermorudis peleae]
MTEREIQELLELDQLVEETDLEELDEIEESADLIDQAANDAVYRYFREVGGHRLLTHAEEIEYSRAVRAGLEARKRIEAGEDTPELRELVRKGQEAREKLIRHNLRLVVSIAKRYRSSELPLIDLIQEGNIGLMTAVERYDPELGYRFSTYATFWIRQAIGRAVANLSRTIRVPVHMHDLIAKIRRAEAQIEQQKGRPATNEELAEMLGIDVSRIEQARSSIPRTSSLDRPIGEDGESTIGDLLPDPRSEEVVDEALTNAIREQIRRSLEQLTERERGVLILRFGLNGEQPRTLAEIAEHFKISRERVRQIEKEALAKLRNSDLKLLASAA